MTMPPTNLVTMGGGSGTSESQVISLKGITPGWHTFYVQLEDNHHMPVMTSGGTPVPMTSVTLYVRSSG